MPRHKLPPESIRVPAPLRMRRPYLERLRALARTFGISPGEWVELQLEPHMPAQRTEKRPPG